MIEVNTWLDSNELLLLAEPIRTKINGILNGYHNQVLSLQKDLSVSSVTYENTIEALKKKLEEKNRINLELQMEVLKKKTIIREAPKERPVQSKHLHILRNKIAVLYQKNEELKNKEEGLNKQIQFLIQNANKDVQELCQILADQTIEINMLNGKIAKGICANDSTLRQENENLKMNEKEYQNYIFEKTKEIYMLENDKNASSIQNGLLSAYKVKYEDLHEEYLKMGAVLAEIKLCNTEMKSKLDFSEAKKEIFKELEILKDYQLGVGDHLESILENMKNPSGNEKLKNLEIAKQKLISLKLELKTAVFAAEKMKSIQAQLEGCFSSILVVNDSQAKEIHEKEDLIQKFKATIHHYESNNSENGQMEIDLLRREIESLKLQIKEFRISPELVVEYDIIERENDRLSKENQELNAAIDNIKEGDLVMQKEEISRLNAIIDSMTKEIEAIRSVKDQEKHNVPAVEDEDNWSRFDNSEDPTAKIFKKSPACANEYCKDLEEQLKYYKNDVKIIEERYMDYKKLFEGFNIPETQKNIEDMRENIKKKDVLIGKLHTLVGKYRRVKSYLMKNSNF